MNKIITIGQDASCNICINDSSNRISRKHATLYYDGHRFMLEDHSTNGTVVNEKSIRHTSVEVKRGDDIALANTVRLSWNEIDRVLNRRTQPKHNHHPMPWILSGLGIVAVIAIIVFVATKDPNDGSILADNCKCRIFTDTEGFEWDGNCANGYADGYGTITWDSGERYIGTMSRGHITGEGKQFSNNVLVYEGDFRDGIWEGYGTYYYSTSAIARKGYFVNGKFRDEEMAIDKCDEQGRKIVQEYFKGGTNISTHLHSMTIDRTGENMELTFNLDFYGNWETSNYYSCRVIVRNNREPRLEFVPEYSNDNVKAFIYAHNGASVFEAIIDFFN